MQVEQEVKGYPGWKDNLDLWGASFGGRMWAYDWRRSSLVGHLQPLLHSIIQDEMRVQETFG